MFKPASLSPQSMTHRYFNTTALVVALPPLLSHLPPLPLSISLPFHAHALVPSLATS